MLKRKFVEWNLGFRFCNYIPSHSVKILQVKGMSCFKYGVKSSSYNVSAENAMYSHLWCFTNDDISIEISQHATIPGIGKMFITEWISLLCLYQYSVIIESKYLYLPMCSRIMTDLIPLWLSSGRIVPPESLLEYLATEYVSRSLSFLGGSSISCAQKWVTRSLASVMTMSWYKHDVITATRWPSSWTMTWIAESQIIQSYIHITVTS